MKKANFDVSHELDEFLMVEKPLTHTHRKKNVDLDKLKPEFREMEEQYVVPSTTLPHILMVSFRFGVYDSTKGKRVSYYPHNQPVIGAEAANESTMVLPSATNTMTQSSTVYERSLAGTPIPIAPSSTHSRDIIVP